MLYALKENGYFEIVEHPATTIQIIDYIPRHIELVTTPDDRVWRINRHYDGFSVVGEPITT